MSQSKLLSRRGLLGGLLIAAPAIVAYKHIMPVKALLEPYAGWVIPILPVGIHKYEYDYESYSWYVTADQSLKEVYWAPIIPPGVEIECLHAEVQRFKQRLDDELYGSYLNGSLAEDTGA